MNNRTRRTSSILLVLILFFFAPLAADEPTLEGHWEGTIEIPGNPLGVLIDLHYDAGAWSGSCDIPQQGAKGLPLGDIRVEATKVAFTLLNVPGNPAFDGELREGEIRGTFAQAGMSFPFSLGRDAIDNVYFTSFVMQ